MSNQIIVLVTTGKSFSVDTACVRMFNDALLADKFCRETNSGYMKYWKKAEIVYEAETIILEGPTYVPEPKLSFRVATVK